MSLSLPICGNQYVISLNSCLSKSSFLFRFKTMYLITLIIPSRLREEKTRDKVIQSAIEISWNTIVVPNMMNNFGKKKWENGI